MIAVPLGGGFKLHEFYRNLKVRFSICVKDERKLSYPLHQYIDNTGNTGKIDGKIQSANCFIEPKRTCFRKQMLVNFSWQDFGCDFEVLLLDSSERSLIE